jgi:hypothetical protein
MQYAYRIKTKYKLNGCKNSYKFHSHFTLRRSICNVYNMSGRVVSDIQTRAEGESLYIRYNTDANVVNNLKNDSSYKFIGEVILKINVV